jgi:oxygen-independent coproporphyrinogen-3 oxidase
MDALALYIHWPFCLAKCPYCDFNSHVRDRIPAERYGAALLRELETEAAALGRRPLGSIFFGGGTPSLMPPDLVGRLIERASSLFEPADDIEITLEANPTSVEAGRLRAFREAGVNRCSLGVQALDDAALAALGRQHSAAEAIAGLELARAVFPRLSFDLIYARPDQSEAAWRAELRRALALAADHLSLYQLTIEPGTRYEALARRGEIVLPDDEAAFALYEATGEEARRFGLLPYEVSNYARPRAESRHNLAYWRYADYAGIGPGAHGRLARDGMLWAVRRHRSPERWLEAVETTGDGTEACEAVDARDRAREMLLMGLRLATGVDAGRFAARVGMAIEAAVDPEILELSVAEGYLAWEAGALTATAAGRVRLDALLPRLVL